MKTVFDCIKVWESWLNYLEKKNGKDLGDMTEAGKQRNAGSANYTLYAKWYEMYTGENYQAQPYCAMAVSDAFVAAYGLDAAKGLLGGRLYYNCEEFYQRMRRECPERLHKTPKVGDVALFYNGFRHHHTGYVVKDTEGGFVTAEANTSSGNNIVVANGGATTRKSYALAKTRVDFYRPPYSDYGISETEVTYPAYDIGTGAGGLVVLAEVLNVRRNPSTNAEIVGRLGKGEKIFPTQKAFDDRGVRWYYIPGRGWVSGTYLHGWVQEENDRWWYLLEGDTWYSSQAKEINGAVYAFDAAGYMVTEPITLYPDVNGALQCQE